LLDIIGKKLAYVFDTGWEYHIYYENDHKVTYYIASGPAGGRFAYQEAIYAEIVPGIFNVVWYEETGTLVSQVVNLNARKINGFIAFPQWVWRNPEKTHGRKEEKVDQLLALREAGPDAPRKLVYMTANIRTIEDIGVDVPGVF